jgi:hypothetical protein
MKAAVNTRYGPWCQNPLLALVSSITGEPQRHPPAAAKQQGQGICRVLEDPDRGRRIPRGDRSRSSARGDRRRVSLCRDGAEDRDRCRQRGVSRRAKRCCARGKQPPRLNMILEGQTRVPLGGAYMVRSFLPSPGLPKDGSFPQIVERWAGLRIDPRHLAAFRAAVD